MAVKKLRRGPGFVIYSYFKDSAFTAVKRDAKPFYTRYVKGIPFVIRRYTCMKGPPLLSKRVYKRIRGCSSGHRLPV